VARARQLITQIVGDATPTHVYGSRVYWPPLRVYMGSDDLERGAELKIYRSILYGYAVAASLAGLRSVSHSWSRSQRIASTGCLSRRLQSDINSLFRASNFRSLRLFAAAYSDDR